ncbi:MAG: DUF3810 domain-containing protein [Oscillospiraceae bacterium]|nr:DUF3810 domain-containing protein [Oscillospiraceae bacterium]MBQ7130831.1 DUF3810 domain-containing protein [Oscillospiraceae bacterium]
MKYWFGYLTAAIFGAITWVLMLFGERFATLVDMVYPYVIRTMQDYLAKWTAVVAFPVWQVLAIALGVVILASFVLMLVLKWNPIQWGGWVIAVFAGLYMLHTLMWGLNYYAGDLSEDMRLDTSSYNLEELTEATEFYRDKANELAAQVGRDADGNVKFDDFDVLAARAGEGFEILTYDYHYPIFAGSRVPVKQLGWADMYTSMGITGVTFGMTGEAAVNPQIPDVTLPFTIAHEMSHRMCIASERDANFAGFLATSVHSDIEFRYSGYFMAYRYCYNALAGVHTTAAAAAAARVKEGVSDLLQRDMDYYSHFFSANRNEAATNFADTVNDTYLKTSGESAGIRSYGQVTDLLVNWHIQTEVLPSITVEDSHFDPYDESQIDLSGIVNAR